MFSIAQVPASTIKQSQESENSNKIDQDESLNKKNTAVSTAAYLRNCSIVKEEKPY
jgi:hypothetical protein